MSKRPIKFFFDARWTRTDSTHFGVSRYGTELATAFARLQPLTLIIHDKRQLQHFPEGMPYIILNNPISVKELFTARKLNALGAEVVFTPLQFMGSWGRRYKLIVTMHDTFYYKFPSPPPTLQWWVRAVWWLSYQATWPQRFLLNMGDRVATVSRTSKKEIADLHLTDRPVEVIYNAPNKPPRLHRAKKIKKELVFVGNLNMRYKNAATLVRAMNLLPDYKLHLMSPVLPQRKKELIALADNPKQLIFWNGGSDEVMYKVLSTATAAVHASKGEGFGLPLIEAMSMGTPMICTDMPIFHEVGGDAPIYCNPDSPDQYAEAVRRLEQDPHLAASISKKGLTQAKKFNWDVSAKQLFTIVRRLAQRR